MSLRDDKYTHPVVFAENTGKELSDAANYWGLPNGSLTAVNTGKRSRLRYEELRGGWWKSETILESIFDKKYPKWRVNLNHRAKANRLRKIIYAYFNLRLPCAGVAELVSRTPAAIRKMVDRAAQDAKAIMLNNELKYEPVRHSARKTFAPGQRCERAETLVQGSQLLTKDFARILSLAQLPATKANTRVKTQAGLALLEFMQTTEELDSLVEFLKKWNDREPLICVTENK